ncbi:beta-hydroxyacyl-ACP dehydratase [Myxococcota bacterium]|nr:beta-hydroxyacyl-ACP dehydratase [Myxococcota bacterium]
MDVEKLVRRMRRKRLFEIGEGAEQVRLGRDAIKQMIPHREPFLLLDQIDTVDLSQVAMIARRTIDPSDPILRGHFPGDPVYPGALLLEMLGQAMLCLNHLNNLGRTAVFPEDRPRPVRLMKLYHALFLAEVRPDEEIELLVQKIDGGEYTLTCAGQVCKGDAICTVTVMEVYLVEEETERSAL